jgi:hypothetical protein
MPTVVEHTSGPRNRWLLPVVLAVLIAAIVVGAIVVPRLTKSSASPTATARVIVVSPGSGTPAGTGSTPLPGASPVPTVPGLKLGMITHPQREVTQAQAAVDRNDPNYSWYLDPRSVVQHQLPSYGFTNFTIVSPAPSPSPTTYQGSVNRPIIKYVVNQNNQEYTVAVTQPGKQGAKGVWFVVTILKGRHLP